MANRAVKALQMLTGWIGKGVWFLTLSPFCPQWQISQPRIGTGGILKSGNATGYSRPNALKPARPFLMLRQISSAEWARCLNMVTARY